MRPLRQSGRREYLLLVAAVVGLAVGSSRAGAQAGCVTPERFGRRIKAHPDAAVYRELGMWFGEQHQYPCAVQALRSALRYQHEEGPATADLLYLEGLNLYLSGQADGADEVLVQAVRMQPGSLPAHLLLGTVLTQEKREKEARAQWREALAIDPRSEAGLDGMAKSLLASNDAEAAIALLRAAPASEQLKLDLALAYGKDGRLGEAAQTLQEALRVAPNSLPLTSALATVLVQQAHYDDAEKVGAGFAAAHPHDPEAQRLYLRLLVLNKDTEKARPLAKELLALAPHDYDFLYLSGILERQAGEYAQARAHLEEAVRIDPSQYSGHYNLGLTLAQLKDAQGARTQFETALQLGGTEPDLRFALASALRSLGKTAEASEQMRLYQEALAQQRARSLAASKSAQADAVAGGDPQEVVRLLREALAATPGDALLAYRLALGLDRAGDTQGERVALEQAVSADPGMAVAQNQLGYLASQAGDLPLAEKHFRLATKAAPSYTQAWISLAATLGMESRVSEAQEAIGTALRIEPQNTSALELSKALSSGQALR